MWILLMAIVVLGIATALMGHFLSGVDGEVVVVKSDCGSCNGINAKCEQECMMEAATKDIEYFDDESLDRFRGREGSEYSDTEAEEFREVLYTMKPDEVKLWNRSLILRQVNIPDQVRDELLMLLSE
jgi:hypothetical protein